MAIKTHEQVIFPELIRLNMRKKYPFGGGVEILRNVPSGTAFIYSK